MKSFLTGLVLLVCLGLISSANAFNIGKVGNIVKDAKDVVDAATISTQDEINIGRSSHPYILSRFGGELKNPKLKQYVTGVGQKLVRVCDRKDLDYHFTVLNTDIFNAFALPGGYVYVTKGFLKSMKDESELAAVLGHEITHITHKHGVKRLQSVVFATTGAKYGIQASGKIPGQAGAITKEVLNQIVPIFMEFALKGYGRKHELDSDKTGIRFSNASGYDPNGAVRMLEHMQKLEGGSRPKGLDALLASHPDTGKRLSTAKSEVAALAKPLGKATNKVQYAGVVKGL